MPRSTIAPPILVAAVCALLAGPALAQGYKRPACGKPTKPTLEFQVDVPRGPGAGPGYVRHQVMSRHCSAKKWAGWKEWLVVDERGKTLHVGGGEILPLSARHGVALTGFGEMAVVIYGKKPGPTLPYRWPGLAKTLLPGVQTGSIPDRPVVVAPIAVGSPKLKVGDSTTVTMALFTGDSFEPKLIGGLGGRAVFGSDVFGQQVSPFDYTNTFVAADFVMPREAGAMFQNFTAPDGAGLAQMIDNSGEPIGAPIGQVDLIRVPTRSPGRSGGRDSPILQLASRIAPLGPRFPGMWLYAPLDRDGQPIAPLPGSVGYSLLRSYDGNDPALWGAVYRVRDGYEVSLSSQDDGRLPVKVRPERYAGLRFVDLDNIFKSYSAVGLSPTTGRWSVLETNLTGPKRGAPNSFASADAAIGAVKQWQAQYDEASRRADAEWKIASAAQRARQEAEARVANRAAAEAKFEKDIASGLLCRGDPAYAEVAPLGDAYVKRWYETCTIPMDLFADARRLGVSQDVFARSLQAERNRQAYYADLRARGARANGFADAMSAYNRQAGAAPSDPWTAVRVTEGGRTTTQVMRQSEYDRRRP